jgi:hypothetical protein
MRFQTGNEITFSIRPLTAFVNVGRFGLWLSPPASCHSKTFLAWRRSDARETGFTVKWLRRELVVDWLKPAPTVHADADDAGEAI